MQVRRELRLVEPGDEPTMKYTDFRKMAKNKCGIDEEEQLALATSLLGEFGDILHFTRVPGLEETIILRPQWIADVMAMVSDKMHKLQTCMKDVTSYCVQIIAYA